MSKLFKIFFINLFLGLIIPSSLSSQNYEFYGAIKLNGEDNQAISYKIAFSEKEGKVTGYSITDLSGEHETKSQLKGSYDNKSKWLTFSETGIIYTKSPISKESFCFIHYTGKIKLDSKKSKITGNFSGKFKNNVKCIDGTLELVGSESVLNLLNKVNTKIQKSKKLDDEVKNQYNPIKLFDSLQTHQLRKDENLNIFNQSEGITFDIWDHGNEDGDIINFFHNDKKILDNFEVKNKKYTLSLKLHPNENIFKIEAINQGSQGLNTAKVKVVGDNTVNFISNLQTGEKTSITIIHQ